MIRCDSINHILLLFLTTKLQDCGTASKHCLFLVVVVVVVFGSFADKENKNR